MAPSLSQNSSVMSLGAPADPSIDPNSASSLTQDDGSDDANVSSDIVQNLEAHLNSLPDQAKEFLSTYITVPEVATVVGLICGQDVYNYFSKYVDPTKRMQITKAAPAQGQPGAQAPVMNMQAGGSQPQAQAPQGQAPQGNVLKI